MSTHASSRTGRRHGTAANLLGGRLSVEDLRSARDAAIACVQVIEAGAAELVGGTSYAEFRARFDSRARAALDVFRQAMTPKVREVLVQSRVDVGDSLPPRVGVGEFRRSTWTDAAGEALASALKELDSLGAEGHDVTLAALVLAPSLQFGAGSPNCEEVVAEMEREFAIAVRLLSTAATAAEHARLPAPPRESTTWREPQEPTRPATLVEIARWIGVADARTVKAMADRGEVALEHVGGARPKRYLACQRDVAKLNRAALDDCYPPDPS